MTDVNGHENWTLTEFILNQGHRQEVASWYKPLPGVRPPATPKPVELRYHPTVADLIARGLTPPADAERWTPPTLSPMREHLLRRLGLITDSDPTNTDQE